MCYATLASRLQREEGSRLRGSIHVETRDDLLRYDYNLRNILRTRMIAALSGAIDLAVNTDVKANPIDARSRTHRTHDRR